MIDFDKLNPFRKRLYNRKALIRMSETLQFNRFNRPMLLYLERPPRGIFEIEKRDQEIIVLTKNPIEISGQAKNVVVNDMTLSLMKALCYSGVAPNRVL